MNNRLFFLFVGLLPILLSAQGGQKDSRYVDVFADHLQASLFAKYSLTNATIRLQDREFDYRSLRMNPGLRLQFDKWGIGLALPINLLPVKASPSKSFALQVQAFPFSMVINAGLSRIKGSFNEREAAGTAEAGQLRNFNLYFNPVYALNSRRFSLNTLYNLDHRQLQSQGSPLVGLRMEYSRIRQEAFESESDDPKLEKYHFRQTGIELGYAYTYVFDEPYFVSGLFKSSIAQTDMSFKEGGEKFKESRLQLNFVRTLLLTLGYQYERSCVAVQFHFNQRQLAVETLSMEGNNVSLRLLVAYRFYEAGLKQQLMKTIRSFR